MPKTVYQRTKRDAKELGRTARVGDTFYVVHDTATSLAPYEDGQLYSAHTVTFMHRFSATPAMISGSYSVEAMVLRDGPVYTQPPKGMRNLATPGPQVAGPLDGDEHRELNPYEIKRLEKQNDANQTDRKRKSSWW